MTKHVLVVDDVAALAEQYAYDLRRLGGYRTRVVTGGREALEALADEPIDCMILDLEMPGFDGFDVLRHLRDHELDLPVIVYTGTGDFDRCAQAIRLGAWGFIDKRETMQRVVHEVRSALEQGRLSSEVKALRARVDADTSLVGESPAIRRLQEEIRRLAPIPSPVLILGESGSGKELVARDLHARRAEEGEPFVPLNCAALPDTLVESELFGHERGAFTGADRTRRGAFEQAGKGTLFLDEIGELPLGTQAKLLRVLEGGELVRLGGERQVSVEARVVAATHRDLEADVEEKRFRQDLLYRLNVHVLRVPPLRERPTDVPLLAEHFLSRICERFGVRTKAIDEDALGVLSAYDWHRNNVRELRNVVERMVIATEGDTLGVEHVPPEIRDGASPTAPASPGRTFAERKAEAERDIVLAALRRSDGHVTRAAEELGLADHASLLKIMRRLGIQRD